MNLYPAASYLRHLVTARSTAGYGVHSPFMFEFLKNVVRGESDHGIITSIEELRREMLEDRRIISITDMGTGPSGKKTTERRISEISATAALPLREAGLLSRTVRDLRIGEQGAELRAQGSGQGGIGESGIILELGTSLGISTLALALAAPEKKIVSVEGSPVLAVMAQENLIRYGAGNAQVLNMEFDNAITKLIEKKTKVSFAFIDGNHRGDALKHYVNSIMEMGEEMIIVADDIHLNRDMYGAWCCLVASGTASVTFETYRLGMIFLLNKITPGNYRIRY
jgi:precorrin-6B methylase 2